MREGVLTEEECSACDFGDDPVLVDYEKLYRQRFPCCVWPMREAIFPGMRILSVLSGKTLSGWRITLFSWR